MKKDLGNRLATFFMWPHAPTESSRPSNSGMDDTPLPASSVLPVAPTPVTTIPVMKAPIDNKPSDLPVASESSTGDISPLPSPAEETSRGSTSQEPEPEMTRLADEIESLRGLITSNFRHAQTISDQADSLKSISQAMRASEEDHVWDRFLKPIFMETLLVLDDLGKARSALASGAADTANQILAGIETQIDQLLARHDITPMSATPDSFDPNCQKVVGIRSVPPVKSGIVESRPRRGYRYKNRVFRYEEVVIINPVKE